MRTRYLPEVIVKANRKHQSFYYHTPDETLSEEDIRRSPARDMILLLRRIPHVIANFDLLRLKLYSKGVPNDPPMIIVDGMKLSYSGDDDLSALSVLNMLPVDEISQIDIILTPARLAAYGRYGDNGVIEIFTKHGFQSNKLKFNVKMEKPLGYQIPIEFYSPQYDTPEAKNNSIPDLRSTIYWKPDVLIDSDGKTSVDFYAADNLSSYSVIIEGITMEGKLIYQRERAFIKVE